MVVLLTMLVALIQVPRAAPALTIASAAGA
jgi:hypothetical protein